MTRLPPRIRPAGQQDIPAIVELAVEMVVHSVSPLRDTSHDLVRRYRRDDLEALQSAMGKPHAGVFVAEDELDRIIGHVIVFAGQRDSSTGETQAWVFDLAVEQNSWGQGVGRRLMREAEEFARQRGCARLGLGVTLANHRAVRFYRELGYTEERIQMIKKL